MAGHSHWAGIKHKKAIVDAKRGKVFSKISKLIIVAARNGGGDLGMNLSLKYAVDKAKAANMTRDAIERAIKKGTGELDGSSYEDLLYEGYAPGGVAIMIEMLTDNRNRTASEIRKLLEKRGASLAEPGAVAWQFDQKGLLLLDADATDEETLMELVLEAGADDLTTSEDGFEVTTDPKQFEAVRNAVTEAGLEPLSAEITMLAKTTTPVEGKTARQVMALLEDLDDHDDVQRVHANYDIQAEELARIESEAS